MMVIDTVNMVEALGCAPLTLSEWRKAGAPYLSGRPCRYDVAKFLDWLRVTNKFQYAVKLEALLKLKKGTDSKEVALIRVPDSALRAEKPRSGVADANFTIFDNRALVAAMIKRESANFEKAAPSHRPAIASSLKQLCEVFRKCESDCLDHQIRLKELADVNDLIGYIGAAFSVAKNQLRNVAFSAAQEIADVTGSDPALVAPILRNSIDAALEATAAKITMEAISSEINRSI